MYFVTLSCLLCVFCAVIQGNVAVSEDDLDIGYYWREYKRDVPKDALPGGVDKRGKTTYIGQTIRKTCENEVIVTGQIYEAEQKMIYEWGYNENVATKNVQILCTRHPEDFEWIATDVNQIANLKDKHLISGGSEKNYCVYIGRMSKDGEIAIGKVLVTNIHYMEGFYSTMNRKFLHVNSSFEVLSYNPSSRNKSTPLKSNLKSEIPNSAPTAQVWGLVLAIVLTVYVFKALSLFITFDIF